MANTLIDADGVAATLSAIAPHLGITPRAVATADERKLLDRAGLTALLKAIKPYIDRATATQLYPLDTLGYDDDGSLSDSIIKSVAKFAGKQPTDSYASMFNGSTSLIVVPALDYSQTPSLSHFCNGATAVRYVPYIDAPRATSVYAAFRLNGMKYFPGLNAPEATDTALLFAGCASMEYLGELILPKATSYEEFFVSNTALRQIGSMTLNTRPQTARTMFYGCSHLRNFIYEDFAPVIMRSMFQGCTSLQEVRMNLRYATDTSDAFYGCDDCAAWFNWGADSGAGVSPGVLARRYEPKQTQLDFAGLKNWGKLHPASLQYTIDNLPTRAYTNNQAGVLDTKCSIHFDAATKATLTEAQKQTIISKNYTIV